MIIPTLRITERKKYDEMIASYIKNDIRVIRVNMSRHSLSRYCDDIEYINSISGNRFSIMCDVPLPGRKYRIGLRNEEELYIEKGQQILFCVESDIGRSIEGAIPVNVTSFTNVSRGEKIIIGDGELLLTVLQKLSQNQILAIASNSAVIRGQRSFVIPTSLTYEVFSRNTLDEYIAAFKQIRPSMVVLSFSENIDDIKCIESEIQKHIEKVEIIPKIETPLGVENLERFAGSYHTFMLGRGDLGLFSGATQFAEQQEIILQRAKKMHNKIIAATDILTTLYASNIPSRSDLTDVYYLKKMGARDVVASAGISMVPELFTQFCHYASMFQK